MTGEITPQLAGIIQAALSQQGNSFPTAQASATAQAAPAEDPADLKARQEACLQEKVKAAQQAEQAKSGVAKLLSAVGRTTLQYGSVQANTRILDATNQVYSANATMGDLKGAAADLGISESDIEACKNP